MSKSGEQNVVEASRLLGNCCNDCGMAVSVDVYPPGRDPIEQPPAVAGVQIHTGGVVNADWKRVKSWLGKRMPYF